MGLKFEKPEAVQFGDLVVVPKLTTENKLRLTRALQEAKSPEKMTDMTPILAACFPDEKEKVEEFIESYMTLNDMAELAAFIVAGAKGLAKVEQAARIAEGDES